MSRDSYEIENVEVIKETDLALLCLIDGEEVWIPHSQILDESEVYSEGDIGRLVVTQWIAEQKGL